MQDWTIKACDLDTEHIHVLHSPEKKSDKLIGASIEVHIALTPFQPWLFFGYHRQMVVNGNDIQFSFLNKCKTFGEQFFDILSLRTYGLWKFIYIMVVHFF